MSPRNSRMAFTKLNDDDRVKSQRNLRRANIMLNSFLLRYAYNWAGRSVWYDRSVGIAEAAGSNPAPSTNRKINEQLKKLISSCVLFLLCCHSVCRLRVFL